MHDPCTVAFEIKYPWWHYRPWPKALRKKAERCGWNGKRAFEELTPAQQRSRKPHWKDGYREAFITVWHVDPERDGSDDSCGFCVPKLPAHMVKRLKSLAWNEGRDPHFLRALGREWTGSTAEAEALWRGLILQVCEYAGIPMTFDDAAKRAALSIHAPDSCRPANRLCYEPGYHTNFKQDEAEHRERYFHGMICGVAEWILKDRRPWYRHPRWHFWHWRLQVHPLHLFNRWAFSRCCKCGCGFKYGASVISTCWDPPRRPWYLFWKGESHVMCDKCGGGAGACENKSAKSVSPTPGV